MIKKLLTIAVSIIIFFSLNIFSQEKIQLYTAPQIKNFDKSVYNAESQNWFITQSEEGLMYMANTLGLLEYDGEKWKLHPTNEPLHSISIIENRIYVGGINTIGYFEKENHQLIYHSLINKKSFQDEIWKSIIVNDKIIFQSFSSFYIYNLKTEELTQKKLTEGNISFAFTSHDKTTFYYQVLYNQIHISKNASNVRSIQSPLLKKWMVKYINEIKDDLLIGTYKNGLYLIKENKNFEKLDNPISDFLSKARLNVAQPIDNKGRYAFGTLDKGIVIGNIYTGEIEYYINTKNGLASNRIHTLYFNEGLLWVGSESGITKINLKYPVRFISDPLAEIGPVYDAKLFNNQLFIGTNQGLYYTSDSINSPLLNLRLFPGSKGQVWNLEVVDDQLFCGHNEGIFEVGDNFQKVYNNGGGYTFLRSKFHTDVMFQTSYHGLNIWRKENGKWFFSHNIKTVNSLTRDLVELDDTSLVITDTWKNLYRIVFTDDFKSLRYIDNLSSQKIFKNCYKYRLFAINDQKVLATNDTLIYLENTSSNCFIKRDIEFISETIENFRVVKSTGDIFLYDQALNTEIQLKKSITKLGQHQIYNYENITPINDQTFFIAFTKGAGLFSPQLLKDYAYTNYTPEIRKVTFWDHRNQLQLEQFDGVIKNEFNTVHFDFSSKNYYEEIDYSVRLLGYDEGWINLGEKSEIQYQNLPFGRYTFSVKDNSSQETTDYSFKIERPIYLSLKAFFLYFLLFIFFIFIIYKINRIIIKKERKALLIKKREDLNHQRDLNEKRIALLMAKELKEELNSKNESLSELLAQSSKNKKILNELKDQVANVKLVEPSQKNRAIKRMDQILNVEFDDKKDWMTFEVAFKKMHENFFSDIKKKHTNLTNEDLKLCAYIRINLSTKELAPIFSITPKSVDLKRYRLRKKMGLERKENLYDYINKF